MTITAIKEKLHSYVENGDLKKVKAFYAMIEDEINEGAIWTKEFKKKMDKRAYEMDNDLVKTYSWEEVLGHVKDKKRKKR